MDSINWLQGNERLSHFLVSSICSTEQNMILMHYMMMGKAPNKHKKILVNFMEDNADSEIYSNELKKQAGFGKDGRRKKDLMVQ